MRVHAYGWRADIPDGRDLRLALTAPGGPRPSLIDLRPNLPPVWDQGQIGSCTGNACAAALAYCRTMQGLPAMLPARLMLYWFARYLAGNQGADAGAQIRDVIKAAARWGACDESLWPYDPARVLDMPDAQALAAGTMDEAIGYHRVDQTESALCTVLSGGDPIVFGFTVHDSFESDAVAKTGLVPMPDANDPVLGGHAVLLCGYDDDKRLFLVRNSWGAGWGDAGYCWFPYAYLTDPGLAADFWTVRLVSPEPVAAAA